jgi:1-acyl-sn-glycerol-3-phosphate acyltransferase
MLIGGISAISLLVSLAVCLGTGAFGGGSWIWLLPVAFAGSFLALTLAAFLFLMYLCKRVDQSVPQEEDDKLYRVVTDLVIQAALPVLRIRTKVTGMEKMPKEGRFLLVSNHCDNSDPILLLRAFAKYQLAFVSKQENSDMFVIGPMMHKIQCQLINRENDREALKTILNCIRILKEDKASVGVFPEGGILSEDGKLHRFRPGVFKIAQKAGVPIVVCTLHNTKEVVKNIKRFRGTKTELHVLEVIPAEELKGVSTIDIARRVHKLMADDLGPDLIAEE